MTVNVTTAYYYEMYIVQKYTEKMKNKNTHEMIELGLLSTHELYHKINVFIVELSLLGTHELYHKSMSSLLKVKTI